MGENNTSETVYFAYVPAGRVEKGGSCESSVGVKARLSDPGKLAAVTASAKKSNRRNWVVTGGLQVDDVRPGQGKPVFVPSDQIEYWAAFKERDEFCFFKVGLNLQYRRHTTKIFQRRHAEEVTHRVGAGSMKSAMEKLRKDEDRYFIGEEESESESDSDSD